MKEYFRSYKTLVQNLDEFFSKVQHRYPDAMLCKSGCADCCHRDISLFPFEADILVQAIGKLPLSARQRILQRAEEASVSTDSQCPLLHDGKCEVYDARSVICRTHGLPCLVTTSHGRKEMSFCPYNFDGLMHIVGDCVLDLDPVNAALATINHLACADLGAGPDRVRISRALLDAFGRLSPA